MGHLKNYCNESSIHGFKYIGETNRHKTEKIFWGLTLFISSICCGFLIFELIEKVQKNPIIFYLADVGVPVMDIQFPSVTFCPEINTNVNGFDYESTVKKIENNLLSFDNLTEYELGIMHAIGLVMNDDFLLINNISIGSDYLVEYIKEIKRPWYTSHLIGWMKNNSVDLAGILTPWGFCYSFNMMNPEEVFHLNRTADVFDFKRPYSIGEFVDELNRATTKTNESYPWRTQSYRLGFHTNIQGIQFDPSTYKASKKFLPTHSANIYNGHHYIIHAPHELPGLESKQFYAPINQSINILLNAQISNVDESLHDLSPEERNCYLENEKKLRHFKVYSKQNCEQECLSNYTLSTCGCIQYYMIGSDSDKLCNIWDKKCFNDADDTFNSKIKSNCKCYLPCDSLTFDYQTLKTDFIGQDLFRYLLPSDVNVKFKAQEFYPLIRRKQFSLVELFSFVGGLLGLFAGFSVLSFVELIYYFTLRIGFEKLKSNNCKVSPMTPRGPKVKPTCRQRFVNMVKDIKSYIYLYLNESSIHGMVYLGSTKKHWFERIFWLISFIISMATCGILIYKLHQQFINNPITMTMDAKEGQVQEIPFPAITFFGEFEFSARYGRLYYNFFTLDKKTEDYLNDNHLMFDCLTQVLVCKKVEFFLRFRFMYGYGDLLFGVIKNYSRSYWFKEQYGAWNSDFSVPFAEILTRRGYAFAFNVINSSDLYNTNEVSAEYLYDRDIELNRNENGDKLKSYDHKFPWATTAKLQDGLKLILTKNSSLTNTEVCLSDAFVVHNPFDVPMQNTPSDICQYAYGITMDVIITPEVINTDPDLVSYSLEKRQCYLEGERKLRYFKVYSRNNCEIECLSNFTLLACKCVPFYSVHGLDTRTCSLNEEACVLNVEFDVKYNTESYFSKICNCLLPCNTITYSVEYIESSLKQKADPSMQNGEDFVVTFKYRDNEYIPLRRYQQFTLVDFLAGCGGLLGLFVGVSVLSIVELFHFFSLRMLVNLLKRIISWKNKK